MKTKKKFDKIIESILERIQEEVGGLIGAELLLTLLPSVLISKEDFFDQLIGKQILAKIDIAGEVEGKGCLLVSVKDAIRLGGTLIMLPPAELEEVVSSASYKEETEDSYGEIANIIAGSYSKAFEEMYPKACRFIRKEQQLITPIKVDIASDDPVPEQQYYQITSTMQLDGKQMGEMIMLVPATPFDLGGEEPKADHDSAQSDETNPVIESSAETYAGTGSEVSNDNAPPETPQTETVATNFDVEKHKKKVDALLETSQSKIQDEVGALLGVEVSCSGLDNRLVSKEDFFADEASGKQIVANMDVVGDLEDNSYLYIGLKDAVRIGCTLIMLPPSELEIAVSEEDFGEDCQDAYGEIANIISGVYTATFEEQYNKSLRFIKKDIVQIIPMKVDSSSDEPMPDQLYYLSSMKIAISGIEYGSLQMVFPAKLLELESLAQKDSAEQTAETGSEKAVKEREGTVKSPTSGVGAAATSTGGISIDVLIVSDSEPDAESIRAVLNEKGLSCEQLSFRDSIKNHLPGSFKAVFLVMNNVDEQSFGVAIKISSACSIPLIATGAEWTRTKVIKAVKYGVSDILLTPASSSDIEEKIQNTIVKMAA